MSASVPAVSAPPPPSPDLTERLGRPGIVAGLWALVTLFYVIDLVRFPGSEDATLVSSELFLSAVPVVAALVAAAIAGLGQRALALAGSLLLVDVVAEIVWLPIEWAGERAHFDPEPVGLLVGFAVIAASAALVYRAARRHKRKAGTAGLATLAAVAVITLLPGLGKLDARLMALSYRIASHAHSDEDLPPPIDQERLWTSQPSLVADALAETGPPRPGPFVVAIGAGGSQDLFGREARYARTVLGHAFGAGQRAVLLANDQASLYRVPLASGTNLNSVLTGLTRKIDPSRDLVVIYLTSHGSRDARLMTNLPDYTDLRSIGAARLAGALERAGIRRRVIVVSACYSGSWIKPLASDDTILITAARADRTSFGCSDDRQLTYFGEALLKGPLAKGASLAESFDAARKTVTGWEGTGDHSEPQAFVGRNMAGLWKARPSAAR